MVALAVACLKDAPRDNPLDASRDTHEISLRGQVLTYYQPRTAIENAVLTLNPGQRMALSDAGGYFAFSNVPEGTYMLKCRAEKYAEDSVRIQVQSSLTHQFFLDGKPYFKQVRITTHHLDRWFPIEDVYYLNVQATADDPDGIGDISRVWYRIPDFDFSDTLQVQAEGDRYQKITFLDDLPVTSLHQLIGKPFVLSIRDDYGARNDSGDHFLTRIIDFIPSLVYPTDLQTIDTTTIEFEWKKVTLPFPHTLRIEIFQINFGLPSKVDEILDIPAGTTCVLYEKSLPASDYYWQLVIVDEFGNTSSSKESTFRIKE